jgi:hypothetical protein
MQGSNVNTQPSRRRARESVRQQETQIDWVLPSTREFVRKTETPTKQSESHVKSTKASLSNARLLNVKVRIGVHPSNTVPCNFLVFD